MYPLPVFNKASRDSNLGPPASFTKRAGNQPSLLFDAMSGTIALGRGGVAPSFTNATVRTITDQDLVVRQVLSGEARFGGFRRVRNLLTTPETFAGWSNTTMTVTSGVSDPFGGTGAYTLTATGANSTLAQAIAGTIGLTYTSSVWIRRRTGTGRFQLGQPDMATYANGDFMPDSTWRRYTTPFGPFVAANAFSGVGFQLFTSGDAIDVYHPQSENVTGQSNKAVGEYQSVGVLAAPYQGANVDGVKYYPTTRPANDTVIIGDSFAVFPSYPSMSAAIQSLTPDSAMTPKGVAGNTLTQIEARFAADVIALAPKWVFIEGGVNDLGAAGADPNATMQAKITAMVSAAQGASITPILSTVGPWKGSASWSASRQTWTETYNTWILAYAASNGLGCYDIYSGLVDPATPQTILPAYDSGDHLHPNMDGYMVIGRGVSPLIVTPAQTAISSSILGGYLPEPAATDLLTARADARDMTTANWTLGATMTRARTSVGADGVANKATRLTGGAVAATNIITTTITAAASSRTYSVLIKRVTGTGPVRLTQDNFATNTDISSLINSSTYTLVQINQSQLNAVLGIKIDTNGDAIDADWNQFSAGDLTGLINSRIPDTISTRNADVLTYATTGWLNAAAGTLYAEWFNPNLSGTYAIASINDGTVNNTIQNLASTITTAAANVTSGGVAQGALTAAVITGAAIAKSVNIYQLNDFAGFANNASLGTDGAGTIPTVTQLQIGAQFNGLQLGHYVRKVSYYPIRMVNESAKALTV